MIVFEVKSSALRNYFVVHNGWSLQQYIRLLNQEPKAAIGLRHLVSPISVNIRSRGIKKFDQLGRDVIPVQLKRSWNNLLAVPANPFRSWVLWLGRIDPKCVVAPAFAFKVAGSSSPTRAPEQIRNVVMMT